MDTIFGNPIEMGKSIADIGFVIMAAGGYLVHSSVIIFLFVKWFVRTMDRTVERQQQILDEMLQILKELYVMVKSMKS